MSELGAHFRLRPEQRDVQMHRRATTARIVMNQRIAIHRWPRTLAGFGLVDNFAVLREVVGSDGKVDVRTGGLREFGSYADAWQYADEWAARENLRVADHVGQG